MSDADKERWNARYASGEYIARTHPSDLLASWIDRLPRGRALDVACGAGRNAIFLASKGYRVEAMDISSVALERASKRAQAEGLEVRWIEADLERIARRHLERSKAPQGASAAERSEEDTASFATATGIPRKAYRLVVVARFLDRPLIPHLIDALAPGGYLVYDHHYIVPASAGGLARVGGPPSIRFRARPNELLDRFRDLRIVHYEEGIVEDPDRRAMALARLVACKGDPGF
ncbi:methyltransferase domain-containing protein [Thioalkalivibrio sp. HK1]|uniref:methyltransferase domain-containing protein n=1 Tax=Thioalkalivibrio sp. HK1 TaxID=1469245 RepID=UPI00046EE37D|nr:methyltransferase domain-containing protein [Thioalkalivibrio sp. HK1]